ncbi:hypothetical protein F4775DRAFT_582764 [Biscogniauxia sp. FL1348]|nr:hypothetical protein F4775DRAFT_582764 [Biscogniauxia sp. FL1348]
MATNSLTNGSHPPNPLVRDCLTPLKVVIVGAGIGGLSAAIGLRRNGHRVKLYEKSRFASETGAAIHLAPNANGLLRRWGIFAETFGANGNDRLVEYDYTGRLVEEKDLAALNKMWQHPWLLVHRATLQDKLREFALAKDGQGPPAVLYTASKVIDVQPEAGEVTLEDGTIVTADVIVGADGVYSKTRAVIHGNKYRLFSSGKAAFRFLIPKKVAEDDPVTAPLVAANNTLSIWYSEDRRIVIYPCSYNTSLNFVCIHPDTESHAVQSDEWSKRGSLEQVLKVYKDFDPAVKRLLSKVDPAVLRVWQLMDMEKLPSWTQDKLALIGDAAHPFTPHQGQGAGQAIEDAVALSVVLPPGTAPFDVPERLKLYEKIRYNRAHTIQQYSREAGEDRKDDHRPKTKMMTYVAYNFGHDEYDNSTNIFKRWLWAKNPGLYWRMPISFGPFPGPQQDHLGRPRPGHAQRTFLTASVRFTTSRTYLETLFPAPAFKFGSPATLCTASVSATTLGNVSWLGGGGYTHWGLYIHGVEYRKKDGSSITGTYLPVLFEDLADPIISGREESGMPKIYCEMDISRTADSYHLAASWRGAKFLDLALDNLKADDPSTEHGTIGCDSDYGILTYRYIPAVGEPGKADAEYACVIPHTELAEAVSAKVQSVARSTTATIKFDGKDWDSLPTLHHVASGLEKIPIYEVISAKVVEGLGAPDVSTCRRID